MWLWLALVAALVVAASTGPPSQFANLQLTGDANGLATNSFTNLLNVGTAGTTVFYGSGANLTGVVLTGGGGNSNYFPAGTNIVIVTNAGPTGTTNVISVSQNVVTNNAALAWTNVSGFVMLTNALSNTVTLSLSGNAGTGGTVQTLVSSPAGLQVGVMLVSASGINMGGEAVSAVQSLTATNATIDNLFGGGVTNTFTNLQVYGSNNGVTTFFSNTFGVLTNFANYTQTTNNATVGAIILSTGLEVLTNVSGNACLYVPTGQKLKVGASSIGATDGYVQANGSLLTALNGSAVASGTVAEAYLGGGTPGVGKALLGTNGTDAVWGQMTNLLVGAGDLSLVISGGNIDTTAMLQSLSASNGYSLTNIAVTNLVGSGGNLTNISHWGYVTNQMSGSYSTTNWTGTNDYVYWATNLVGAGTNWLFYTNANAAATLAYNLTFTLFGNCQTNASTNYFIQKMSYVVTNGLLTTGACVTNIGGFTNYGIGWVTPFVSNSVVASAGFGLSAPASVTNTMSYIAKVEFMAP